MSQGTARIYNGLSILFLVLALMVIVFVVLRLAGPEQVDPARAVVLAPTAVVLPTATQTNTPRPTLPPTFTSSPTVTPTQTSTPTPTLTVAPSATITETPGPTLTPSNTPTPSISPTPEASPTSAITATPTDSPYLFEATNGVEFRPNTFNTAQCAYQAVTGQVIESSGLDTTRGFNVRVYGSGVEQVVVTGSNTLFGASGWEVIVNTAVNSSTYFARLETPSGTPISPDVQVTFNSDCNANVAFVRFQQVRDFGGAGGVPGAPVAPGFPGATPLPGTPTGGGGALPPFPTPGTGGFPFPTPSGP